MAFFKYKKDNKVIVMAPIQGKVLPLESVPDPVFAQKMMGDGIAILAEGDCVYSPIDGVITLIAETKHAFGVIGSNGIELMVHVGLDTVNLQGEGFEALTQIGTTVKQGTPILKLNKDFFMSRNVNLITPVIVLNHTQHPVSNYTRKMQVAACTDELFQTNVN